MEGTAIFEGTVMVERDSGKVYLVSNNCVNNINEFLAKFTGDEIMIVVSKA